MLSVVGANDHVHCTILPRVPVWHGGFTLKGKVTHYDSNDAFQKSGQHFYGGQSDITRSLYIGNVLYTLSQTRLQLNDLSSLATLRLLPFGKQ